MTIDLTYSTRRTNTYVRTNLSHLLPTAPIANATEAAAYDRVWTMQSYSRSPAFGPVTVYRPWDENRTRNCPTVFPWAVSEDEPVGYHSTDGGYFRN